MYHGIRSKERVRELGEVFTPLHIVNEMLRMVEEAAVNDGKPLAYDARFFEPACGPRGFIIEVLRRKLRLVESLPETKVGLATEDLKPYEYKSLAALGSIYGGDIDPLNISDCRFNLKELLLENYYDVSGGLEAPRRYVSALDYILGKNIFLADLLDDAQLEDIDIIEFVEAENFRFERRFYKFTDLYTGRKDPQLSLFKDEEYSGDKPRRIIKAAAYKDLYKDAV
ncbi:MAG: hypothetical protein LBT68_04290 [Spirochaetales bacterium]|nr:hypothetical protein [Spirochaetales bacterium]